EDHPQRAERTGGLHLWFGGSGHGARSRAWARGLSREKRLGRGKHGALQHWPLSRDKPSSHAKESRLLYNAYELHRSWLGSASNWASIGAELLNNPALPMGYFGTGPIMASALQVFAHLYAERGKPSFNIDSVTVGGKKRSVTETVVLEKPFGGLRRFRRTGLPKAAPKLLIVAPMSGHYATLLRGTVARMVENQDVWVTDWADAKAVPLDAGHFDLDDYIDYLIEFLQFIGPDTHVLAVCQPSVPAFAAAAVMAAENDSCRPATLTLMGGPIDTRASPTSVNDVAVRRPL